MPSAIAVTIARALATNPYFHILHAEVAERTLKALEAQLGMAVLQRVAADTEKVAKVEAHPRMEGRQMLMVISPK